MGHLSLVAALAFATLLAVAASVVQAAKVEPAQTYSVCAPSTAAMRQAELR